MTVRLVCDHCSGELEVTRVSPGRTLRCPQCGETITPTAMGLRPRRIGDSTDSSPRSIPPDRHPDDGLPWFVWLSAFVPATMLAFVTVDPIAIGVAAALVAIALIVATRMSWSQFSRITGIASLTFLGLVIAAVVQLSAQGSFARLHWKSLILGVPGPILAEASWNEWISPDDEASVLFPGEVVKNAVDEPNGVSIAVFESKFPKQDFVLDGKPAKQDVTFAVHSFRLTLAQTNEAAEAAGIERMHDICRWIFFDAEPDTWKRIFFQAHPGFESQFTVLGRRTTIICRAYLVRDKAYILSVRADAILPIKEYAERFLSSFQLVRPKDPLRTPRTDPEPDWEALGRPPVPSPKPRGVYRGHINTPIIVLAFSEDGQMMVTGSGREHLLLWDIATGHGWTVANTDGYRFFAIPPSGNYLVLPIPKSLAAGNEVRFVSLRSAVPRLGRTNTDLVSFTPDEKGVVIALDDHELAWDIAPNPVESTVLWKQKATDSSILCQALSPDSRLLATASVKGDAIHLWDTAVAPKKLTPLANWPAHVAGADNVGPMRQLAFSRDGKTLASAGIDDCVKLWNVTDPKNPKLAAIMLHEAPVNCVEYSNDGKLLATGDFVGVVRIWNAATGKLLHEFRASDANREVELLRFSPDNTRLAAAVEMGLSRSGVHLYDLATLPREHGSQSLTFHLTDEPPLYSK